MGTGVPPVPKPARIARKPPHFVRDPVPSPVGRIRVGWAERAAPALQAARSLQAGGRWFESGTAHARFAGISSSEVPRQLAFIQRPSNSRISRRAENVRFERVCRLPTRALVEVAVALEDEHPAVRVAHLLRDNLDVTARGE